MNQKRFTTRSGLSIAADIDGDPSAKPVVLLHGGGQTRGSWKNGLSAIAAAGYYGISLDSRGHGESDWDPGGDYSLDAMIGDLSDVLQQLPPRPALVGASMGGITSLALMGESEAPIARALVLVDVTPKIDPAGAHKIVSFMRANPGGFASIEEAADAVSAYNSTRPRPKDLSGLKKNLREINGRFFWHWDPELLAAWRSDPVQYQMRLEAAARNLTIPTLLVRGSESNIVGDAEAAHFRDLMPDSEFVDVKGAGHMVAGDKNDAFNAAIIEFLTRIDSQGATSRA